MGNRKETQQESIKDYLQEVENKRQSHLIVVNLAQKSLAQFADLRKLEIPLQLALSGGGLWGNPVDPEQTQILLNQHSTLRSENSQTQQELSKARELASVKMPGWGDFVSMCTTTEPDRIKDEDDEDQNITPVDEDFCRALITMHQAHEDTLGEYSASLCSALAAMETGDLDAQESLSALAEDITRGKASAATVENDARLWLFAADGRSKELQSAEILANCHGLNAFFPEFKPSSVVSHFMNARTPSIYTAAARRVCPPPRTHHRARRTSAGHGASAKSGDDGDGDGDGEPPRPCLSFPFTHHLAYPSAFSATPILGGRP
ncbi:MAG: hypothetical protein M0003_13130 [Acidithiobacillus sp.]|nr:hypothetical protein [Acidithiobacillus sp.]